MIRTTGVLLIAANDTTPWYACPRVRGWMILGLVVLIGLAAPARAHQASLTHSDVTVAGAEVRYVILIAPADLEVTGDDARAYVLAHIGIADGDTPCPAGDASLRDEDGFVRVAWTARCPGPITQLILDYDLLFEHDPTHEAVLRVHAAGDEADTVLAADRNRFSWDLSEPPPSGTLAFVESGVDHILFGFDHIAFVLTLLVALALRPRARDAVRATALLVSSFTVAHSLTLIAASLGWVEVPARVVEAAIALSIVYTAIENMIFPEARWRPALTFGFGLLHGLGFARMLEVMLPPDDVVVPLLAFNVGVELGQLAIVAVALPLLLLLARALGPVRYRRYALPAFSVVLALLGVMWLVERL